jgi:hypothetical protein
VSKKFAPLVSKKFAPLVSKEFAPLVRKKVSGVERLTARRGIERGPIEQGRGAAFMLERLRHDRLESTAVRVGVIDAGGHATSTEAPGRSK